MCTSCAEAAIDTAIRRGKLPEEARESALRLAESWPREFGAILQSLRPNPELVERAGVRSLHERDLAARLGVTVAELI